MICDELTPDEAFEAYILYASLHGFHADRDRLRQKLADYFERNIPDDTIDDALWAYLDDKIIAPPDVILDRWGSSRFYEVAESQNGDHRHRVCEAWFQNGCEFPEAGGPGLAHFWTEFSLEESFQGENRDLQVGTRLQFEATDTERVLVVHRTLGCIGELPHQLCQALSCPAMQARKFLPLVDVHRPIPQSDAFHFDAPQPNREHETCRLLVTTADAEVAIERVVEYAAKAFHAVRSRC